MDANIVINNEEIPITWENGIKKGVILYVQAPGIINAIAAVQSLLDQLGFHQFWYSNEVTCQAGVFQFEIVEAEETDWKDWSRHVLPSIMTPNDQYNLN